MKKTLLLAVLMAAIPASLCGLVAYAAHEVQEAVRDTEIAITMAQVRKDHILALEILHRTNVRLDAYIADPNNGKEIVRDDLITYFKIADKTVARQLSEQLHDLERSAGTAKYIVDWQHCDIGDMAFTAFSAAGADIHVCPSYSLLTPSAGAEVLIHEWNYRYLGPYLAAFDTENTKNLPTALALRNADSIAVFVTSAGKK